MIPSFQPVRFRGLFLFGALWMAVAAVWAAVYAVLGVMWGSALMFGCNAGVAVFLASSASDFVTGTAIPVDGGFSVQG